MKLVRGIVWMLGILLSLMAGTCEDCCARCQVGSAQTVRSRAEFAAAISLVKEGMTADQALALLGKPDDTATKQDPKRIYMSDTREIWRYGTSGHLTFATLGEVYIDTNGKVQFVYGGSGTPPPTALVSEPQLRALLRVIDHAQAYDAFAYNPLTIIQIVNTLQPLGKERALAALAEYIRVAPKYEDSAAASIFLILRVLFDIPADTGTMPRMYVGETQPPEPSDRRWVPRFPVVLMDDIPILLVASYGTTTALQEVPKHLAFFRLHGVMRSHPLRPPDHPLEIWTNLIHSRQWIWNQTYLTDPHRTVVPSHLWVTQARVMMMNQLLRMVAAVYPIKEDEGGELVDSSRDPETVWQRILVRLRQQGIHWNPSTQQYLLSGGHLSTGKHIVFAKYTWKCAGTELNFRLDLERRSVDFVDMVLCWTYPEHSSTRQAALSIVTTHGKPRAIKSFPMYDASQNHAYAYLLLKVGTSIQVHVAAEGKRLLSPTYKF